jgi:hypothetical protein
MPKGRHHEIYDLGYVAPEADWIPLKLIVPREVAQHLKDRIASREIGPKEVEFFLCWARSKPLCPPDEEWYKRFSSFTIVGRGDLPLSVLRANQKPAGIRLGKLSSKMLSGKTAAIALNDPAVQKAAAFLEKHGFEFSRGDFSRSASWKHYSDNAGHLDCDCIVMIVGTFPGSVPAFDLNAQPKYRYTWEIYEPYNGYKLTAHRGTWAEFCVSVTTALEKLGPKTAAERPAPITFEKMKAYLQKHGWQPSEIETGGEGSYEIYELPDDTSLVLNEIGADTAASDIAFQIFGDGEELPSHEGKTYAELIGYLSEHFGDRKTSGMKSSLLKKSDEEFSDKEWAAYEKMVSYLTRQGWKQTKDFPHHEFRLANYRIVVLMRPTTPVTVAWRLFNIEEEYTIEEYPNDEGTTYAELVSAVSALGLKKTSATKKADDESYNEAWDKFEKLEKYLENTGWKQKYGSYHRAGYRVTLRVVEGDDTTPTVCTWGLSKDQGESISRGTTYAELVAAVSELSQDWDENMPLVAQVEGYLRKRGYKGKSSEMSREEVQVVQMYPPANNPHQIEYVHVISWKNKPEDVEGSANIWQIIVEDTSPFYDPNEWPQGNTFAEFVVKFREITGEDTPKTSRRIPMPFKNALLKKDASGYKVVTPCRADVDNRYDVELKVGELLTWLGGESGGTLYQRSNGEEVFVDRHDDSRCIKRV